jgi:hypothetical protein
MTERWTYEQEKIGTLKMMYSYRQMQVKNKWVWQHPLEDISWAYGEGEGVVRTGLDLLIGNTIYLMIVSINGDPTDELALAGRIRIRAEVQSVLDETSIDKLLADIPEDEAREIRYDLEILGFIPPDITKPQWG